MNTMTSTRSILPAATLLVASLMPQATASYATRPELPTFRAEVADAIARQGNQAVIRIRAEARRNVALTRPAALAEMASMATEVAQR